MAEKKFYDFPIIDRAMTKVGYGVAVRVRLRFTLGHLYPNRKRWTWNEINSGLVKNGFGASVAIQVWFKINNDKGE